MLGDPKDLRFGIAGAILRKLRNWRVGLLWLAVLSRRSVAPGTFVEVNLSAGDLSVGDERLSMTSFRALRRIGFVAAVAVASWVVVMAGPASAATTSIGQLGGLPSACLASARAFWARVDSACVRAASRLAESSFAAAA